MEAVLSDAVSFGHCFFLWTRLVQTRSLSEFLSRSYAVSFGLSFGQCGVLMRLLTFGRDSFGRRIFRTLFLDAVSFTRCFFRTRMLCFGRCCYSLDADASVSPNADALPQKLLLFLGRGCFLGRGFLQGSVDNLYPCTMIYVSSYI